MKRSLKEEERKLGTLSKGEAADHQETQGNHQQGGEGCGVPGFPGVLGEYDVLGQHDGGAGNRHPHEQVGLSAVVAEHVEAGQPQGSAEQEQKGENQAPWGAQHAEVDHGGRNDPEGAQVDQGIEFDSEAGVLADEAGDAAVHRIEGGSEHDQPGGGHVAALDHVLQRQESAEQIAHGEHVGKHQTVHHSHTPMMVSPALTRSPTSTVIRTFFGSRWSTREPKRMSPKRCPRATSSPSDR